MAEGVPCIPTGLRGKLARNCGAPFLLPTAVYDRVGRKQGIRPRLGTWKCGNQSVNRCSDGEQAAPFPSALAVWGAEPETILALDRALPDAWRTR